MVPDPGDSASDGTAGMQLAPPLPTSGCLPTASEVAAKAAAGRKAALSELVARKREALKKEHDEKQAQQRASQVATERWSGLRITDRCVRQEKWDMSMKGKELVGFGKLSTLRPAGRDQVVIGVLYAMPVGAKGSHTGEKCAEMALTDLNPRTPQVATLVLTGRAMDHWASAEGAGRRHCTIGSIIAVLNPSPLRRPGAMTASVETQVLKLGTCPSLRLCDAKDKDGLPCRMPFSAEGRDAFCSTHASMSHGERQACLIATPGRQRQRSGVATRTPVPIPSSSELRALQDSHEEARRKRRCPEGRRGTSTAVAEAAEQAALRLSAAADIGGASGARRLLDELKELEASTTLGPDEIRGTALYEHIGMLVQRPDEVGMAAKRLRRSWRLRLDSAAHPEAGI